jgi:hypothetical protein
MADYIIFIIIITLLWYWWNSITAYEIAYKEAKLTCRRLELQFLDDTLDVIKLRLCRHPKGHMQVCRTYEFEFSSDGDNRYKGYIKLGGLTYESIDMDAYTQPS